MSYLASIWRQADGERKIVEYLRQYNSQVLYDYQLTDGEYNANGVPSGPLWIRYRFGDQFFSFVTSVDIIGAGSMAGIECIQGLRKLESLTIYDCDELTNVDCLSRMPRLRELNLGKCRRLTDVDSLKTAKSLRKVALNECTALSNVDVLVNLPNLVELELSGCEGLKNYEVLRRLRLRKLDLMKSSLTDVDVLQDQNSLQELFLDGSQLLTDVEGLKDLKQLQKLDLRGCEKLTAAQVDSLRKQLPGTNIAADY